MDGFQQETWSSGGKVVDLAAQVFGHKAQIEGLRGINHLRDNVEISGYATEMPVQVSCESCVTGNPHQHGAVVLDKRNYLFRDWLCVAGDEIWIVRELRGAYFFDFGRC